MIKVSLKEKTINDISPAKELEVLESLYDSALEGIKGDLVNRLMFRMSSWQPEPSALERYPFFANLSKFLVDYTTCFKLVTSSPKGVSLVFDAGEAKAKGLPLNILSVVEYGDEYVPPFPHIRNIPEFVSTAFKKVKQGLNRRV